MIRVVLSTFPDEEAAVSAIRVLVKEHLAACGNILPNIRSIYRWKGKMEENPEILVIFKTSAVCHSEFEERLRALHPYEVPEILAFDPSSVSEAYAQWVSNSCKAKGS